jgi:site-specific recombinase
MMEQILSDYALAPDSPAKLLTRLVAQIRPAAKQNIEVQHLYATHAIQALCHVLETQPNYATILRTAILDLLGKHKPVSLLVDSGIHPSSGFFTEIFRRIGHKLLPDAVNPLYLKDLFALIFPNRRDEDWVIAVPDTVWLELMQALHFEQATEDVANECQRRLLDALQVLSYRLSASGLEPELILNHPELEDHASPFIVQNIELGDFLADPNEQSHDIKHILVMLDQCRQVIAKIRRNSSVTGTSIRLTFLLQRMSQQIMRLEDLLGITISLRAGDNADAACISLFKELVSAECHKNDVRKHWRENMEILALRVTENASRTGEHYITESRSEYFSLMRSAMGAGIIIAVMAMIKIITAKQHYAPLTEGILFSLNYGLGFVIIHILHFTVATKQPAMTAAAIAASIDNSDGKTKEMDSLVNIIAQTIRSQTIAIIGNISLAVPVAILIGWSIQVSLGHHFIDVDKAHKLLSDLDFRHGAPLIYAGIAGVCLFLSGLIAGYHDNLAVYNKIPQRLRALGWLKKLLGQPRLDRVAGYIENNLGALAGNFYFGCLLGGMSALGVLLGLPIDIRHIAFSSAFVGFSFMAMDFNITWQMVVIATSSVLLIGTVNLLVSFSLALYVAMKSRKVTFAQWRHLLKNILKRLWKKPSDFFLPPKNSQAGEVVADSSDH